jgi:hypothetical protein
MPERITRANAKRSAVLLVNMPLARKRLFPL